ncbi:ankyrin repeat domain-containing protein 54 [Colletes latitarsis]|uniref:ankyrin repeat domain-containing protein 54 n=1 Tax=Colletes latitarsis TaxID=2605962 RepID=UPI004036A8C9
MTSVDSGVETGNDSNDSSIVQYENLSSNQIDNVSSTVATTNSTQKKVHENESGSMYHRKMKSFCASFRSRHYVTCTNIRDPFLEHKMRLAAATNNTSMMRRLLCSGVSPNNHDEKGRTALHVVSCRGYTEMAKLLLEYGADPNQHDYLGNTPLHFAAVACQISMVTLLVKAGADILTHGYSPLQLAQTELKLLQHCKEEDMLRVKEEIHNIVNMLLAYLQKQKDAHEKVECLSSFYSRLSLSNTSDQVQDDVKDLLANLDALSIKS